MRIGIDFLHQFTLITELRVKMKFFVVFAAVVVAASALEWAEFKKVHNKTYKDAVEESIRLAVYNHNLDRINEHNKRFEQGLESFKMGVNKFADMTGEEFEAWLKLSAKTRPTVKHSHIYKAPVGEVLAADVDWRTKGAVTPVKDQGQCGSCWSFSATGALESANQINKGKLQSLSEQNLVDCSWDYGNMGCSGGWMGSAYDYIKDNGINSEEDYPYEAVDGNCRFDKSRSVSTVKGYGWIEQNSEQDLQSATANVGPVAVAIDATMNMQFYSSGVFDDNTCSPNALNHGVLAVGYGSEGGQDFWIVKNSWGASWGEDGYIRMRRNKNNMCGIATQAVYPTV